MNLSLKNKTSLVLKHGIVIVVHQQPLTLWKALNIKPHPILI